MKYIWEEQDFNSNDNWGLMAKRGDELVIIGGTRCTSLRDGHIWTYDSEKDMAEQFNKFAYIPMLAPINPSIIIKAAAKKKFNYGGGLDK